MTGTVLVAGGTGRLGARVVERLRARGLPVRVLSRDVSHDPDCVKGDVRDPASLERAMQGVTTVVSAVHGFAGPGGVDPRSVDRDGNANLIRVAERAGVDRFVLISIHDASPDHPMELLRMKYAAEQALKSSTLRWTIIRPTAYMETWAHVIGDPLLATGKTMIFGSGTNPINFVSVADVAKVVEAAVTDGQFIGRTVDIGGPEDVTFDRFVGVIESVTGRTAHRKRLPRPMMRMTSVVMKPFKPELARHAEAGVAMDTRDMSFTAGEVGTTKLDDAVRRELVESISGG
jgi:uncharacterized protein YbjT (DUF2867 family)